MLDAALISAADERKQNNTLLMLLGSERRSDQAFHPAMFGDKARVTLLDSAKGLYDQAFQTAFTFEKKELIDWEVSKTTSRLLTRVT